MSKQDILARIPAGWFRDISIGRGWHELVFKLDRDIASLDPNYEVIQVKEKWGGLRYYLGEINPAVWDQAQALIAKAELKAVSMCEECGAAGSLRKDLGWMRTLCDVDHEKVISKRS